MALSTNISSTNQGTSESFRLLKNVLVTIAIGGALLGLIVGVSLLLGYFSVHMPSWVQDVDGWLYRAVAGLSGNWASDFVFLFLNDPGLDYTVAVAACLGYVWVRRRDKMVWAVAGLSLALVIGAWTDTYFEWFGIRPRPFVLYPDVPVTAAWRQLWSNFPTFPSGHVRELTSLTIVLCYFWPRAKVFAIPFVVLIAFTRVFIGAHYPTDVLAALVIGFLTGAFSVLTIHRLSEIMLSLGQLRSLRQGYDYLFHRQTADLAVPDPLLAKVLRSGLLFSLLVFAAYAIGYLIHTEHPLILAAYLNNTDNSLTYALLDQFEPRNVRSVQTLFWLFLDPSLVLPVLAATVLAYSAFGGWKRAGRTALIVGIALATVLILVILLGPDFVRPRPFATKVASLFADWPRHWPGPAAFPDWYVLTVGVLCVVLARLAPRLRAIAYLYPFLVTANALYFGVTWPTIAIGSLVVAYLSVRYAEFLGREFWRSRE